MKTRTKKPAKANGSQNKDSDQPSSQAIQLADSIQHPPQVLVLPKGIANAARIITIPHYNHARKACRFLVCPNRGFFEFTTVADKQACQSWLLTPNETRQHDASETTKTENVDSKEAYILRDSSLLIATPIDPVYIIIPMMVAADAECSGMYRTLSDILYDDATTAWQELRLLGDDKWRSMQQLLEARMAEVSDVLQLGNEEDATYRFSSTKLALYMLGKAVKTVDISFPPSLEERFVRQALEMPSHDIIASEEEVQVTSNNTVPDTQSGTKDESSQDSDQSNATAATTSTAATSVESIPEQATGASEHIKHLLRIRTTFEFMLRSYVPKSLQDGLSKAVLSAKTDVDFSPLLEYEVLLQSKRSEVQALRTLSENISRKRKLDDEEAADKAEEKRRKKEEEEAKKKSMSHGVKKLMKADTSGMKKLSAFFTKKPAK